MDQLLANIPKNLLVALVIAGTLFFVILSDPPHTVCKSQIEVLNKNQARFLYKDPKSKIQKVTKYERLRDHCKMTNTPGGCYELFQEVKMLLQDLSAMPENCGGTAGSIPEVKRVLWETAELLVELAWGSAPPSAYSAKFGWLEASDLSLFCRLKTRIVGAFGESSWTSFRERMMTELPGAKDLPRNQVWDMTIFSENCSRYP